MSDFDYRCLDCKHEWDEEDGATWPARCPSCGSGSIEDPDDEGPPEIAADTTSSNPWDGVERRAKFHDLPGSPFAFRRFATHPPLVEGAAYGTSMVERRTVKDRRRDMALLPIRRRNPVDYAAREAAGEQFTEGQKRDAILSGGIVPEHWVAEIAGTLGIDLPGPKPIPTEDEFVLAVLKMFGGRLNPALVRDVYHQLAETERFGGR